MLGVSAIVKGINVVKKHQKQDQKNEGGILNKEMPIKLDNLMLLDKKDNKPTRVRTKILKDKKKVRISVLSGDQIDA
jgi:large subunit ribosomal protein L24